MGETNPGNEVFQNNGPAEPENPVAGPPTRPLPLINSAMVEADRAAHEVETVPFTEQEMIDYGLKVAAPDDATRIMPLHPLLRNRLRPLPVVAPEDDAAGMEPAVYGPTHAEEDIADAEIVSEEPAAETPPATLESPQTATKRDEIDLLGEYAQTAPEVERPVWKLIMGSVVLAKQIAAGTNEMSMGSFRLQNAEAQITILQRQAVVAEWMLEPQRSLREVAADGVASRNIQANPQYNFDDTLWPADATTPLLYGVEKDAPTVRTYLSFIRHSLVAAHGLEESLHLFDRKHPSSIKNIIADNHHGLRAYTKGYWLQETAAKMYRAQAAVAAFAVDKVHADAVGSLKEQREAGSVLGLLTQDMAELTQDREHAGKEGLIEPGHIRNMLPRHKRRKGGVRAQPEDYLPRITRKMVRTDQPVSTEQSDTID